MGTYPDKTQSKLLQIIRRFTLQGRAERLWILLPALLALLLVVLLASRIIERKQLQSLDVAAKKHTTVPVKALKLQARDIVRSIQCSGVIQAWQKAVILSEVAGKVISISARVGDQLEPGSPILKIDDEMVQYAVDQAEAKVLQLQATYATSSRELERKKSLFSNKVVSAFELEIAKAKSQVDQALLREAQALLNIAQRELRETLITSPIKGILAERTVDIGSNVGRGTNVATVVEVDRVKIKVGVSDKEIAEIRIDQKVQVQTDAYPQEHFAGSVYSVGTKADDATLTFPVEIILDNNQPSVLKPGMVARVTIDTGMYSDALSLPQEAILGTDQQHFVWTVCDGTACKAFVTTKALVRSDILVAEGLQAGQHVIVSGHEGLYEGCPVQIIE